VELVAVNLSFIFSFLMYKKEDRKSVIPGMGNPDTPSSSCKRWVWNGYQPCPEGHGASLGSGSAFASVLSSLKKALKYRYLGCLFPLQGLGQNKASSAIGGYSKNGIGFN
jgi:hypothetical protein